MELLVKVGNKRLPTDPVFELDWRDGQIISVGHDGQFNGKMTMLHHCIIRVPVSLETLLGTGWDTPSALDIKRFTRPAYLEKYPWSHGYTDPALAEVTLRRRDWFIDYQKLLEMGLITKTQLDLIRNKDVPHEPIFLEKTLTDILLHENAATRRPSSFQFELGTVSAGAFTIGASQDYSTWSAAEADIAAQLTGDLTFAGNTSVGIVESNAIIWDTDTNAHTLKLTVNAAHRHAGVFNTSKHHIDYGAYDKMELDESVNDTLNDVIVEYLQLKGGQTNVGININDAGNSGHIIIQKCIAENLNYGFQFSDISGAVNNLIVRNNIAFDGNIGIRCVNEYSDVYWDIYNNTCFDNAEGIKDAATSIPGTTHVKIKNNLCYNNTSDYVGNIGTFTTSKNVSKDATSPDGAAYQTWNPDPLPFVDYPSDDVTLDATDTILDDGDDLSAIGVPEQFSDDIQDQSRSTWFVGASEYVAAGYILKTIESKYDVFLQKAVEAKYDIHAQKIIDSLYDIILQKLVEGKYDILAYEIKKPTAFAEGAALLWTNESNAYDESGTGGDETTYAYQSLNTDESPSIRFHTWGAKGQIYTATILKLKWQTSIQTGNDEVHIEYTKNSGANWADLLVNGVNRSVAFSTAQISLDANQDLAQVEVRVNSNKVAGGDNCQFRISDIWTEGTYTTYLQKTIEAKYDIFLQKVGEAKYDIHAQKLIESKYDIYLQKLIEAKHDILLQKMPEAKYDILFQKTVEVLYDIVLQKIIEAKYDILSLIQKLIEGKYDIFLQKPVEVKYDILIQKIIEAENDILLQQFVEGKYDILLQQIIEAKNDILLQKDVEAKYDVLAQKLIEAKYDILVFVQKLIEGKYDIQLQAILEAKYDLLLQKIVEAKYDLLLQKIIEAKNDILLQKNVESKYDIFLSKIIEGKSDILLQKTNEIKYDILLQKLIEAKNDILLQQSVEAKYDIHIQKIINALYDILAFIQKIIEAKYDIQLQAILEGNYDLLLQKTIEGKNDILLQKTVQADYDILIQKTIEGVYDLLLQKIAEAEYDISIQKTIQADYDIIAQKIIESLYDILTEEVVQKLLEAGYDIHVQKDMEALYDIIIWASVRKAYKVIGRIKDFKVIGRIKEFKVIGRTKEFKVIK